MGRRCTKGKRCSDNRGAVVVQGESVSMMVACGRQINESEMRVYERDNESGWSVCRERRYSSSSVQLTV